MPRLRPPHDFEANIIYIPGSPASSDQGRFFGIQRGGLGRISGLNSLSSTGWQPFDRTLPLSRAHPHFELLDYLECRRTKLITVLRGDGFSDADLLFSDLCKVTRDNRGESISILLDDAEGDPARMLFEADHAFSLPDANINLFPPFASPKEMVTHEKKDYLKNWPRRMEGRIGCFNFIKRAGLRDLLNRGGSINVAEFENLGLLKIVEHPGHLLGRLIDFHHALPQPILDELNGKVSTPHRVPLYSIDGGRQRGKEVRTARPSDTRPNLRLVVDRPLSLVPPSSGGPEESGGEKHLRVIVPEPQGRETRNSKEG